jgi:hypothetical protein
MLHKLCAPFLLPERVKDPSDCIISHALHVALGAVCAAGCIALPCVFIHTTLRETKGLTSGD